MWNNLLNDVFKPLSHVDFMLEHSFYKGVFESKVVTKNSGKIVILLFLTEMIFYSL